MWRRDYVLWVELFVLANIAFLALDIYVAHSVNSFRRWEEYIPLYFSLGAPVLLAVALLRRGNHPWLWNALGQTAGWGAIAVGILGVVFHLESQFFHERTLRSLTYAAPFAAPLAYTGLGLLLLMNRMVERHSEEWVQWVLLMTLGGFFGNFVLSLTDHAVNGFFRTAEWIPVVSAAIAVGFLATPLLMRVTNFYAGMCALVLLLQVGVGVLGFGYHALANAHGPSSSIFRNIVDGAPPMAPLLFPNLALLGWIGLWSLVQNDRGDALRQRERTSRT